MSSILLLHDAAGFGWHFLDWTLNFLSNCVCVDNPLTGSTAHGHNSLIIDVRDELPQHPTLVTHVSNAVFKRNSLIDSENFKPIIEQALDKGWKVVSIQLHSDHWLVPSFMHRNPKSYSSDTKIEKSLLIDDYLSTFFSGADKCWDTKFIWDKRENFALNVRPRQLAETPTSYLINQYPILSIDTNTLWNDLEHALPMVFDYCQLTLEHSLLPKWKDTYTQWKGCLLDAKFSVDFWSILNNIVNNNHQELSDYSLDLIKEGLIQHGLIYRYNLNLKTWNLTHFPTNTCDIFKLLEKNIHARSFVYE